jgi:hypothetical protein
LVLVVVMAAAVAVVTRTGSTREHPAAGSIPGATAPSRPAAPTPPPQPGDDRPMVPWLATPAPPVPGAPAAVAPCGASQLRVVDLDSEGATGHVADFVEIENAAPQACSVAGRPLLELRDARGRLVARSGDAGPFIPTGPTPGEAPGPFFVPPRSVRNLPPRDVGERSGQPGLPFFSLAQGACPGGVFPARSTLLLVLPGAAGRVPVTDARLPLPFDYRCDLPAGRYPPPGRPELLVGAYSGTPVANLADNPLVTVDLDVPPRVAAGAPLRYRLRIRTGGNSGVSLALTGCPGYTQRLVGVTEERHLLNCAGLGDTPVEQLLVDQWFEMVLPVPRSATPGTHMLTWQLDAPFHGAQASKTVDVTRR